MSINDYKKTATDNIDNIPNEYKLILNDLLNAESGSLHRNSTEADITTGTGIYRVSSPNAEIFKYIDMVAANVTTGKSNTWDTRTISVVNGMLDKDIIFYYSYLFYKEFYSGIDLSLFPDEVILDITNLYANSPQGCKLAISRGAINLYKIGVITLTPDEVYEPMDKIGPKTINVLKKIRDRGSDVHSTFIMSLMFEMQQYYCNLITGDKDKVAKASAIIPNIKYLNGWGNRLDNRLDSRLKGR